MPATTREYIAFRLPPEQMRRLERLAKRRGQTKQAFVEGAVHAEMTAEEQRRGTLKVEPQVQPISFSPISSAPPEEESSTSAFNLSETLKMTPQFDSEPTVQTAPPPQVVVQVGNQNGHGSQTNLDLLTSFITSASSDFDREHRFREAVTIIKASVPNEEEQRVLVARLDEMLTKQKKNQPESQSLYRTARVAFDKIADLLK